MDLRTLLDVDFDKIHQAFNEAFSDYVVPLSPTREQLLELLTRRGWRAELSIGAFHDESLVGFAHNALDGDTAYNSGTGVVPSKRRGHVALDVMLRSVDVLLHAGARRYVLEVIEANAPARALYTRMGFKETRRLQSWTYESAVGQDARLLRAGRPLSEMWDIEPSWQNSMASLRRARAEYVVIGDERGYAVVFPVNGDVAQLAVAKAHRRRGLGRQLLESAASLAQKPLRIMNVDVSDVGSAQFLEACGARRTVVQIEMTAELG